LTIAISAHILQIFLDHFLVKNLISKLVSAPTTLTHTTFFWTLPSVSWCL